jgi:hypothetical protein
MYHRFSLVKTQAIIDYVELICYYFKLLSKINALSQL